MKSPLRIFIATVSAGAGHSQAAAALDEAWRIERPRDSIARLDMLDFVPQLYRKVYLKSYVKLVERAPDLWHYLFKKTDDAALLRKLTRVRRTLSKWQAARFVRQMRDFQPDVVLCTHFSPLEIAGRLKAKARDGFSPLTVSMVTDFEAHALWMEAGVDLYCVAAEETKARLVARGAAVENVAVTGIPIAQKFSAPVDPAAVRRSMGLRDDLPMLLVLGGGFGLGPVAGILAELNKLATPVQVIVVCGRNEELRPRTGRSIQPAPDAGAWLCDQHARADGGREPRHHQARRPDDFRGACDGQADLRAESHSGSGGGQQRLPARTRRRSEGQLHRGSAVPFGEIARLVKAGRTGARRKVTRQTARRPGRLPRRAGAVGSASD